MFDVPLRSGRFPATELRRLYDGASDEFCSNARVQAQVCEDS